MPETSVDPYYLLRWDFARRQSIGRDVVQTRHRLTELPRLSEQSLQRLLQRIPSTAFIVHTMGNRATHPSEWQTGVLGDLPQEGIMDAVRQRRLWLTIPQIEHHDDDMAGIVTRLTRELMECHVGLRIFDPQLDLILCSPTAQQYYGCDATPSVLFHLRGRMRIWVYPDEDRFIAHSDHEWIAQQRAHQRLYFEPAFDRHAQVFDVRPAN